MKLTESPTTQHCFEGHTFYLKRDDLLHSHFSGNKARKFMSILEQDTSGIETIISYGSAQSNAMYSLAALAQVRGWRFEYYVNHIPQWLKDQPIGNYRGALELGMNIISMQDLGLTTHPKVFIHEQRGFAATDLYIPEGGSFKAAELGVKQLAREVLEWTRFEAGKQFVVALPSGTGTTALYLHKHLKPHGIDVITCPCVGGEDYLTQQFNALGEESHPTILTTDKKHHFGHLYCDDYDIWNRLSDETNIEFDLLYDPYMWQCLLPWLDENPEKTLIYIHQGGLLGNESMLPRYQREFDNDFCCKKDKVW